MKMMNRYLANRGFILIPVILTLTLLAAIAFMMSRQGAINAGGVVREHQPEIARYVAEAGLNHALWQANASSCTGYTDLTGVPLGQHSYTTTITPTTGSPVAIKAVGTHTQGASYTYNRDQVKIYQFPNQQTVLQPGVTAGQDTYLYEWENTWNYGLSTSLWVRNNWANSFAYSLFNFDVSSIPTEAKIISATLELWQNTPSSLGGNVAVRRITSDWSEGIQTGGIGTASWNESDAAVAWSSAGGDYSSIVSANTTIPAATVDWYQWEIASLVSGWVSDAASNQGFILTPESVNTYVEFSSSDSGDPTLRPKLTITYACECGQTCGAPPPVTFCEADYTPNTIHSEFSSSAIGAADAQAITYLPEGIVFNGITSPAGGAWILIDAVDVKFYMTDMTGSLLTSLAIPISSSHGGVFISSGTYANHIALTNTSGGLVYVDMNGVNVSGTLASGSSQAAGIGFVGTSSSGTYDDHILILDLAAEGILVRTQAGVTVQKISVNDGTLMPVQDVKHLPGSDKIIVTYDPNKAIIYDLDGTKLREVDLSAFGVTLAESTAINPLTCEHVVADIGSDRVVALNFVETLPLAHWKLDETSGLIAVDSVGGHDGTLNNGPVWSTGQVDGALNFDGTNDAIQVPHANTLSLTDKMTFVAWVNASSFGSTYQTILAKDSGAGDSNYYFGTWQQELVFGFFSGSFFHEVFTTGLNLQPGTWYELAVTFDNATSEVKLYVDGALVHSDILGLSPVAVTADLSIGRSPIGEYWPGLLDDVRMYDSVLPVSEIAYLYTAGSGSPVTPPPDTGGTVTLNPVVDSYVDLKNINDNFGSTTPLTIGGDTSKNNLFNGFLSFDVLATVPANATITSAELRLYEQAKGGGGGLTLEAHRLTMPWIEAQITGVQASSGVNWASIGGDYAATVVSSALVTNSGSVWDIWNITPLVQEWVDSISPDYGLILIRQPGGGGSPKAFYTSREGLPNQPELVITYTVP